MRSITLRVPFDAAHRLMNHTGKCRFLHGHSYIAFVTVVDLKHDDTKMVMDFADLKAIVKKWIDDNWDHNILLNEKDPLLLESKKIKNGQCSAVFNGRPPYQFFWRDPTAEAMAQELYSYLDLIFKKNHPDVKIDEVRIQETENCSATYTERF